MSTQILTCPTCRRSLRSGKPVPPGASLRCPECKESFKAPASSSKLPLALIVGAAALLGAGGITGAVLLSGSRHPAPEPEAKTDDEKLKKLEEKEKKLVEERKALEDEKAKLAAGKLIDQGDAALKAGQFAEAEKLFDEAVKLFPTDAKAITGLVTARSSLASAAKAAEADEKRGKELAKLLADGLAANTEKKWTVAVPLLEQARILAPTDKAVLEALAAAKAGLEGDETQKKTKAEYDKVLASAKLALDGNRFADAAKDYAAALVLMPDSADAKEGLKAAEGKLAGIADAEKRQKAVEDLLAQARAAQGRMAYKEAVAVLQRALRLVPEDRDAQRLLNAVQNSLDKVKKENASLVTKAKTALANLQYDEAVRLAGDAARAWPEDEAAKKLQREAERARDTAVASGMAYIRYLNDGTFAMNTGRYADAVAAFTEAVRLNPLSVDLQRELRNARLALERDIRNKAEYERQIRLGTLALGRSQWGKAQEAFNAAAKLLPDDLAAKEGLSKARYGKAMAEGTQALNQRKKPEALAAFKRALDEMPGDAQALEGQRRAKALR